MPKNMTVKDVAAKAGVSVSTAAAAIRGAACVRPVTADRILKVAEEMGYRRNSAAAVMASLNLRNRQKQTKIAILTTTDPVRQRSGYVLSVKHAIAEAQRLGIQCEHVNLENPGDLRRTLKSLEQRGCDGIVIASDGFALPDLTEWRRFSLIALEKPIQMDHVDIVRVSQFRTTLKLLRHLQESGFQRIGFFERRHSVLNSDDAERFGAFASFDRYHVKPKNRIPAIEVPFGERNFEAKIVDWYRTRRPDVIVGFSIEDSRILTGAGISIPEEVSWVCLHVEEYNRGRAAGLQFNQEIAPVYAVRMLLEKIRHGIRGFSVHPSETAVHPALLAGSSCPRLQGNDDF